MSIFLSSSTTFLFQSVLTCGHDTCNRFCHLAAFANRDSADTRSLGGGNRSHHQDFEGVSARRCEPNRSQAHQPPRHTTPDVQPKRPPAWGCTAVPAIPPLHPAPIGSIQAIMVSHMTDPLHASQSPTETSSVPKKIKQYSSSKTSTSTHLHVSSSSLAASSYSDVVSTISSMV